MNFELGFISYIAYYIVGATTLLASKKLFNPPSEVFRKLLHGICVLSIFVLIFAFETWHEAAAVPIVFAMLVYPIIWYLERYPRLMAVLIERRPGEIKQSLLLVFFMMASLIAVYWGLFGIDYQYVVLASVLAWGFGDAAAALIGKSLGKHVINHQWSDGKKTVEGFFAMILTAWLVLFCTLILWSSLSLVSILCIAVLVAPISAFVELISKGGIDTLSVPLVTSICIYGLSLILR